MFITHSFSLVLAGSGLNETEWQAWGREPIAFPDLPVEATSTWRVFRTQERLQVAKPRG